MSNPSNERVKRNLIGQIFEHILLKKYMWVADEHLEKCSALLFMREMQIKTIQRYSYKLQCSKLKRLMEAFLGGVEKLESAPTSG